MAEPQKKPPKQPTLEEVLGLRGVVAPGQTFSIEEAMARSAEQRANRIAGRTEVGGLTPQQVREGNEFFFDTLPRVATATAASLVIPGSGLVPVIQQSAAAGLGDFAFQLIRESLGGEKVKPLESVTVAGGSILTAGMLRGIIKGSGVVGGIRIESQRIAGGSRFPFGKGKGFRLTFGSPGQRAEVELGKRIADVTRNIQDKMVVGRAIKVDLLKKATATGQKMSTKPVVETLRSTIIPGATEDSAVAFNKVVEGFANRLEARGPLTPIQFDILMTKELAPKAFTASNLPSTQRFGVAVRLARTKAKETLELALGPKMVEANALAFEQITNREFGDKVFGPSQRRSIEMRLRNLFKPGHEAEQEILGQIGKEVGIDLEAEALRLATKRNFTKDDRVAMGVLNRVFILTGTPQIFRGITKALAPLQRLSTAAGAGGTVVILDATDSRIRTQNAEEKDQKTLEDILNNP